MATRFEKIYEDLKIDLEEIKNDFEYNNLSNAFGHFVIKNQFGISDDDVYDCNTDGKNDNGIDAIYFENDTAHFFQFKFQNTTKTINTSVTEDEILKLTNGFLAFTGSDEDFDALDWNDLIIDKRNEFINSNYGLLDIVIMKCQLMH